MNDADLIEASLIALAGREAEMRAVLFERFFARFPERRALFIHVAASSVRMTDETLQWMYGLAAGKGWVWAQVCELVFNHRNYDQLHAAEYAAFIDLAIDALRDTIGGWDDATEQAWRRQAEALNGLVERAMREWTEAPLAYP
jgi:hypothetical protein